MDNIIKQLKKGAKHTRLTSVEKAEMKSALLRHVQNTPVRNEVLERRQFAEGDKSLLSPFQINNLRSKKSMPILAMLGLLMGGSASFAAENTVPGDILYPVKVHVNEAVRGVVAVTPKAKAEWEVRLVERRLEEVEKLATTPNALPEVQQIAQTNLSEYTSRVKEHIAKFDDENDSEDALATAENLADVLRTHEEVLAGLNTQGAGAVATSTASIIATTTTGVATSITPSAVPTVANTQSLASVLAQLHADRGEAEKKHSDLEHKYHPEVQKVNEDNNDNGSDEGNEVVSVNPAPVLAPVVSTASGTTTITTTAGTSTSAVQTAIPAAQSSIRGNIPSRNEHEEVRETSVISAVPVATTPAVSSAVVPTTEHVESPAETQKTSESSKPKEND